MATPLTTPDTEPTSGSGGTDGDQKQSTLGLPQLTALVVGSMVGGGIFGLPMNMAQAAAPGPLLIGWGITGVGMLMLALTFTLLARLAPNPDGGVYGYARDGFGRFLGFSSAWGYWISALLGNLSYFILVFSTLGLWWPSIFGEGNTLASLAGQTVLLWLYVALMLRGVREAAGFNLVITIAKIVPILAFVVLTAVAWDYGVFSTDFWGHETTGDSILTQVRGMMIVTVWMFVGIEGATVYSQRARNRKDISKATVVGFLGVIALLVAVNMLSAGILSQAELAGLQDPSMAGVLKEAVGPWGAGLVSVGLLVSVIGALLAWMLLCAEILSVTARDGAMPRGLATENKHGTATWSVLVSALALQASIIYAHFAGSNYLVVILMAGSMILLPYLLSALYGAALAWRHRNGRGASMVHVVMAAIAALYSLWLIYAGGLNYLLMTMLFYVPGLLVYLWAQKEGRVRPAMKGYEWVVFGIMLVGFIAAVVGLQQGWLSTE
ncbi:MULTISPECIES: basic amino acid/polyamine antiporter [Kytococcus]|uniref:Amino acid permease n=1 Tax=Kytococcus schroeteri TaxID=138300 RepID=A0A2I1PAF2_9MICO|nr:MULTISPECIES: basic amino acid/polyamine antiporter [Kytococcus]PKZ41593.1 amino acid permease [Kytococcus schroeteri]